MMEEEVNTLKQTNKIAQAEKHPIPIDFLDFDHFMVQKFDYFIRSSIENCAPWLNGFRY